MILCLAVKPQCTTHKLQKFGWNTDLQKLMNCTTLPFSHTGVGEVWLCVCQRQRDTWKSEDDGELHLQLPEHTAGGERMDASSPLAYGDIWSRAQSDQSLESSCLREQKVSDKRISNGTLPQQASYGLKCWWFYSAFSHLIAVVGIIISLKIHLCEQRQIL